MLLHDYFGVLIERLYRQFERALVDLTDAQWHWVPEGKGNSAAFIAWHYLRTEDNIIRWILQDRRPTVWMEGGWAERLGLPPVSQGTGMPAAEAHALRIRDTAAFLAYMRAVRASTEDYLSGWDGADAGEMILLKPVGEMTRLQLLGRQTFPHGFGHVGEIQHLRALMDLPGIGL